MDFTFCFSRISQSVVDMDLPQRSFMTRDTKLNDHVTLFPFPDFDLERHFRTNRIFSRDPLPYLEALFVGNFAVVGKSLKASSFLDLNRAI